MIAPEVVDQVRRLLDEGRVSQRGIARRLGVSRGTVNAIAQGRRPDYAPRPQPDALGFIPPRGLPRRCPGCGGKVKMPCLLCYVRSLQAARQARRSS